MILMWTARLCQLHFAVHTTDFKRMEFIWLVNFNFYVVCSVISPAHLAHTWSRVKCKKILSECSFDYKRVLNLYDNLQPLASEGWRGVWQPSPQSNQEPLVVKDPEVRRLECNTLSFRCFDTVGWVTGRASVPYKLGVGLLVVMIRVELCAPCSSSCHHHVSYP